MPTMTVHFTNCGSFLSDPSEPDSAVMLSTIFFSLAQDGEPMGDWAADVRLSQGSDWRAEDIEVESPRPVGAGPQGRPGSAHMALSDAAKTYPLDHVLAKIEFRKEVEAFQKEWTTTFDVDASSGAGW
jgi:hypothetical protein